MKGAFVQPLQRDASRLRTLSMLYYLLRPRLLYLARFVWYFKRLPQFSSPQRLTDKLALRILSNQCSDLRQRATDKLACREIVSARCPALRIKKIHAVYERPEEFMLDALPRSFVLKPNNASGLNLVVVDKNATDEWTLRRAIAPWFRLNYYHASQEPCYRNARNKVFAEEVTLMQEGIYPHQFRVFCFQGKARFIDYEVNTVDDSDAILVDTEWKPLPAQYACCELIPDRIPRPALLEEALATAEKLATGFDFMRVDLYDLPEGLVFSEMTSIPWGGLVRLRPAGADELLGRYWEPYSAGD